jgi:hypothetical protein
LHDNFGDRSFRLRKAFGDKTVLGGIDLDVLIQLVTPMGRCMCALRGAL